MDTTGRGPVAAEQFFKRGQSIQMRFLGGGICCGCRFELNFIDRAAEGPQQVPSHCETQKHIPAPVKHIPATVKHRNTSQLWWNTSQPWGNTEIHPSHGCSAQEVQAVLY